MLRFSNTGFTLIELLAAVAIVAILSSVGVMNFGNLQKNNRDQARLRDLNTFKQSLEFYRSNYRSYPAVITELPSGYLSPQPGDSKAGWQYGYKGYKGSLQSCTTAASDCTNFVLCASQEGNNNFNKPSECESVSCGTSPCAMGLLND